MAILEVVGIASILPFMHLAANPDMITENEWLFWIYNLLGFESYTSMLIFTGVAMLVFLTLANLFRAFTAWLQYKVAWDTAHNISSRLFHAYLKRPYSFFLNKNSSDLQAKIVMEVGQVCTSILIPLGEIIARSLVVLVIFCLLLYFDAKTALIIVGVLGSGYTIAFLLRKGLLEKLGEDRIQVNLARFRSMAEALTGIKTTKVYQAKDYFFDRFETASKRYSEIQPRVQVISIIPKSLIEIIAFGGIIGVMIYLIAIGNDLQSALPMLSLFAVSGYRLLPSLQILFMAATKVRHTLPVLDSIYDDLTYQLSEKQKEQSEIIIPEFEKAITIDVEAFYYEGSDQIILKNLNLELRKGQTIAFVGSTGSGKSTIIDLLVGLIDLEKGHVLIDEVPLSTSNADGWFNQIGYVQQDVFLFDESIKRNIAIGVPLEEIDMDRLIFASQQANIYDFIISELPEGYETRVGERGVRLSGGQLQRIGIARALYRNPKVLILDEATSALDGVTESKVIESLKELSITMIIIAHRLSTIKHVDYIYLLEEGKVVAKGSYEELVTNNTIFREMVEFS